MPKIFLRRGKEVEGLRAAGHCAAEILQLVAGMVRPGISTLDLDQTVARLLKERDCHSAFLGYKNFPAYACISVNEEIVHGIGKATKVLQNGDIVKIDVGIVKDGWIGDNATTVPVGALTPEVHQLLRVTEESLLQAISFARAGAPLKTLCGSVEKFVNRFGYTVVRQFVGHGVGRKLHEEPQVPNFADNRIKTRLEPGMVLAIEPMVNMGTADLNILSDRWTAVTKDGRPSAHFEHTILVTEGDPEILTPRPRLTAPIG